MKPINLLMLFLLFLVSCKSESGPEEQFNKVKWATRNEADYPYRDRMLNDLMSNHELHGMKYAELLGLLGLPTRKDSLYLFYMVTQERLGVLPLHTKTLVFKLSADSVVEWLKIHQ